MKEQLVSQLQTQIGDLERFIHFLQGTYLLALHDPCNIFLSVLLITFPLTALVVYPLALLLCCNVGTVNKSQVVSCTH